MRVDEHEPVGTEIQCANGSIVVLSRREGGSAAGSTRRPFVFAGEEHRNEGGEEGNTSHEHHQKE
jgi:hypothetical protein